MTEHDTSEPAQQVTLEELKEQYLAAEHSANTRVTSSRMMTPEQKTKAQYEADESKQQARILFSRMVAVAANEFLSLSDDHRLNYLQELRNSLRIGWSYAYSLSQSDLDDFSDQLTIKVVEKLIASS